MPNILWGENTAEELAAAAQANAQVVVPLGCTEQHAHHLPVDTDTFQVERLTVEGARRAEEQFGVTVRILPVLPFGPAAEHYPLPGTIHIPNEVYLQFVKHLILSVMDGGFRRVAVVCGCTGHFAVRGIVWDIKAEARRRGEDVTLRVLNLDDDWRSLKEKHFPGTDGGHAAVVETALALAERPALVRTDRMRAPQLKRVWERYVQGGEVFLFDEVTDTGALGNPMPATAAGGRALWQDIVTGFAAKLRFLDEQDRLLGRL